MKTISRLFREVHMEIVKIAFLNAFLNSCLAFFGSYLVIIFFDLSWLWALIFAAGFFAWNFYAWKKKLDLETVEKSNPVVKEMLRTAHDNQNEKNVLVLGLFYDVVKNMKKVSSGNMIDSNLLFKKVLAITILTFAVVFVSSLEIYLGNIAIPVGDAVGGIGSIFSGGNAGDTKNTTLEVIGFNESSGLYGQESLAKLGKEELNLNINPSISELDFDRQKSLEEREFSSGSFPEEVSVQSSDFSGNDIPEEAELAKAYNLELKR